VPEDQENAVTGDQLVGRRVHLRARAS
jgi:hypothetical protein